MTFTLLIAGSLAFGSPFATIAVPELTAPQERLAVILTEWEKAEEAIKDVRKIIRRTNKDKAFNQTTVADICVKVQEKEAEPAAL